MDINNIGSIRALELIKNYGGKNPYLKNIKNDLGTRKINTLSPSQISYIIDNHEKEPILINKVLQVSEYFGTELQKQYKLSFKPEKILVEFILATNDKSYHIFGKLKRNQEKSEMYWVPKTQLLEDPFFQEVDIEVDFEKYEKMDKFVLRDGSVGRKFFDHQKEAVKFLLSRKNCILGLDMGLGKTFCSIVAALESGAERILIICPPSLRTNWEREINCFCKYTQIVTGSKWKSDKFTIISYDVLHNFHTVVDRRKKPNPEDNIKTNIIDEKFDLFILDEAHKVKNYDSNRGSIMKDIAKNYPPKMIFLLTGTPISNRPMDYFNLLTIIKANVADNWDFYARRYCDAKMGWRTVNGRKSSFLITNGASNLEELHIRTKHLLLRKMKTECLDMPNKNIIPIINDLNNEQLIEYNKLWDDYLIERKKQGKRGKIERELVELILLRNYIAKISISNTIDLTINAIEQGHKVIIFANFTDELLSIQEKLQNSKLFKEEKYKVVIHNGEMNDKEKQKSVDSFQQDDKTKVFIGNIVSAGVGITLTAGDVVIFNSFSWVPGDNEQCEDRSFRIGQENDVTVYYQLFKDTIAERMWLTLERKKDIISTVIGGKDYDEEEIIEKMVEILLEYGEN